MSFVLSQPHDEAELPELLGAMWDAYTTPDQPRFRLIMPTEEPDVPQREQGMGKLKEWYSGSFSNQFYHWAKVVDRNTGKLVGAGATNIFDSEKPYEGQSTYVPMAWPEGSKREFAKQICQQLHGPRYRMMNRPHIWLNCLFVLPEYRRKGVATMIMMDMTRFADEKGLEMFLESSEAGRPFYPTLGFVEVVSYMADPKIEEPDQDWQEMVERFMPGEEIVGMWRPRNGTHVSGKPKPWES